METAARRYLRSIHWAKTGVHYTENGEQKFAKKECCFHTQGWGWDELAAAIQERHPTWSDIGLIVPAFFTPARDAVIPTRDLALEAELLEGEAP